MAPGPTSGRRLPSPAARGQGRRRAGGPPVLVMRISTGPSVSATSPGSIETRSRSEASATKALTLPSMAAAASSSFSAERLEIAHARALVRQSRRDRPPEPATRAHHQRHTASIPRSKPSLRRSVVRTRPRTAPRPPGRRASAARKTTAIALTLLPAPPRPAQGPTPAPRRGP